MYRQETIQFGAFKSILLTNGHGSSFNVIPEYGANVNEIELRCNGQSFSIIDGVKTYEELINDKAFKSSVLLPWPNRIKDGQYNFNGIEYQLPINETDKCNALHGFIYKKAFVVDEVELNEKSASIFLSNKYQGGEAGYPFKFETKIKYQVSDDGEFNVEIKVTNIDEQEIPIGFGWHPYIKFSDKVDNLKLQLPKSSMFKVDHQMIPTGSKEVFDSFSSLKQIENTQFDSCFELQGNETQSQATVCHEESGVKMEFWQDRTDKLFNFLQVYTPPKRTSIAFEPQTCGADVFNNKIGLLILKPGESFSGKFGIRLKKI